MIYKYSCKNFYSIKDGIEVRFDVNQNAPSSDVYVDEGHGRVSLVEAVIGPNAAGKTNLIKALAFIKYLITSPPSDDLLPLRVFAGDQDSPTEVSVEFGVDGRLFLYDFALNSQQVLSEIIKEKSLSVERKTPKTLFSRSWDSKSKSYRVNNPGLKLPSGIYARRGSSVIASVELAGDSDHIGTKIFNYWNKSVITNVWESGNRDDSHLHSDEMTEDALEFFYDHKDFKNSAIDILRNLDIGFDDFKRQKSPVGDDYYYSVLHRLEKGHRVPIPLEYESSGTKRAILLLMYIVRVLEKPGGIAAVDELDAYLHPDIVEALVKIFMSKETNPNRAQLLFSSHSHQLLAEFDKQQITLVEKGKDGATDVWRLDDVSGVRPDDNYYAKYIAGAYAAKPKIG